MLLYDPLFSALHFFLLFRLLVNHLHSNLPLSWSILKELLLKKFFFLMWLIYLAERCGMLNLISPARNQTCALCSGSMCSLGHWTTREVQKMCLLELRGQMGRSSLLSLFLLSSLALPLTPHPRSVSFSLEQGWPLCFQFASSHLQHYGTISHLLGLGSPRKQAWILGARNHTQV